MSTPNGPNTMPFVGVGGGVAIFSQAQLDQIVKETIPASLPDGHKNAIVGVVDQNAVQVVAGFSLGTKGEWTIQGAYQHKWTGENSVGARVLLTW